MQKVGVDSSCPLWTYCLVERSRLSVGEYDVKLISCLLVGTIVDTCVDEISGQDALRDVNTILTLLKGLLIFFQPTLRAPQPQIPFP